MPAHSKILVRGRNFVVNNLEYYLSDAANLRGPIAFFCSEFLSNLVSPAKKFVEKLARFFRKFVRFVRWRALSCVFVRFFVRFLKNARNLGNARILGAQNSGFFARNFASTVHYSD